MSLTRLFGLGSEEALYLQAPLERLNLRGLLLGGIILGALGVLDDVTTSQAAAVAELARAAPGLARPELVARGLAVGREHITALVNTLVLAYAGASFPLFLLFWRTASNRCGSSSTASSWPRKRCEHWWGALRPWWRCRSRPSSRPGGCAETTPPATREPSAPHHALRVAGRMEVGVRRMDEPGTRGPGAPAGCRR